MANNRSAEKRIRQIEKRTALNRSRTSRIRTYVRKLEDAIKAGDHEQALSAFRAAEPEMRKGVSKGVLHLNTVSRKLSRLSQRVKALNAAAPGA